MKAHYVTGPDGSKHYVEGTNRKADPLRWNGRITVSINEAPEGLTCLPPLDENVADKLCVFRKGGAK